MGEDGQRPNSGQDSSGGGVGGPRRRQLVKRACLDALAMAERRGHQGAQAEALLNLAEIDRRAGALTDAFAKLTRASSLADDPRQRGRAELGFAEIAFTRGEVEESHRRLEAAGAAFEIAADVLGEADVHLLGARLAVQRTDYRQAARLAERAVARSFEAGTAGRRTLGRAWLTLGRVRYEASQLDRMVAAFETALRVLREWGDLDDLADATRAAAVMLTSEAPMRAAARFAEAADLARQAGDRLAEAAAQGERGEIHRRLGQLAEARVAFDREAELMAVTGYERGQTKSDFHRASLAHLEGDPDKALAHLERMLPVCARLETLGEVFGLELRGTILAERGEHEAAEADFRRALDRSLALGHVDRIANVLRAMAAARLARGELDGAEVALSEALGVAEQVRADISVLEWGFLVRERLRLVEAGLAMARGDVATARRLAERARAAFEDAKAPTCVDEADEVLRACDLA